MATLDLIFSFSCLSSIRNWVTLSREQKTLRDLIDRAHDGDQVSRLASVALAHQSSLYEINHKEAMNLINLGLFTAIDLKIWGCVSSIIAHPQSHKISKGNLVFALAHAILNDRRDVVDCIIQNQAYRLRSRDMRRALVFLYPDLQLPEAQEKAYHERILEEKRRKLATKVFGMFAE